jgi:hypothetical protein
MLSTASRGTVDQEAEDLLHQADDLANALQENPKDKDEGRGKGKGKQAANKVAELERKVGELIGKGKIRPPATTQDPRSRRPAGPGGTADRLRRRFAPFGWVWQAPVHGDPR